LRTPLISATLLLTIVAALGVGIGAGYLAVMAALFPLRRNSRPAPKAAVEARAEN
jgi:hypothetical protein